MFARHKYCGRNWSIMALALADKIVISPLYNRLGAPWGNAKDIIVRGRVRALLRSALEESRPDAESTRVGPKVQGVRAIHGTLVIRHLKLDGSNG